MKLRKITIQEFEIFEKEFIFEKLANPYYRLGQAVINHYPDISRAIERDGEGYTQWYELWNSDDRTHVLNLIEGYIIK